MFPKGNGFTSDSARSSVYVNKFDLARCYFEVRARES